MNHQNANDGRKVEMLFGQLQCRPQMKPRARVTCGKPTSLAPGVGLAQFSKCTVHTSALHLAGSPTGDSYAFRRTQTACMVVPACARPCGRASNRLCSSVFAVSRHRVSSRKTRQLDVNRFYPKTQLSWLARLDHSHCNSADPLTDGLEVCCVFYRPGPGGAMCRLFSLKMAFIWPRPDGPRGPQHAFLRLSVRLQ